MHPFFSAPEHASPADLATCRALLNAGSRTFLAASLLLPQRVGDPAVSLYAFCRVADDAIDLSDDPVTALAQLRLRLADAYAQQPHDHAADRAFSDIVARYAIPAALPEALLEGFAWDAQGRRYEDLDALTAYAVRVAGTVGVMMSLLMGARDEAVISRACDLGVAMQFSNIARDVGEDARNGRLYLPLQWLREAGVDPEAWCANPVFSPAIAACVERLLREADALYRRAETGIVGLPRGCRPGIAAARLLYAEIGREVERQGLDSISRRAVVSGWRKLTGLLRALMLSAAPPNAIVAPTLPQAAYLMSAVSAAPAPVWPIGPQGFTTVDQRVAWLVGLCERLEARKPNVRHS